LETTVVAYIGGFRQAVPRGTLNYVANLLEQAAQAWGLCISDVNVKRPRLMSLLVRKIRLHAAQRAYYAVAIEA
jgi:hypothetical protein